MSSFSYTTGNPNNLVANQNASMADIQGPFTDLRAFLNGGTMDETNLPNLAAAFTSYKRLLRGAAQHTQPAAGTYLLAVSSPSAANVVVATNNAAALHYVSYLDPALYAANSRTTKLNLRLVAVPNTTAPAVTFTAGLYPAATFNSGAGTGVRVETLGTVISGSTAAIASPTATTLATATSGDFNFPAAGPYVLAVVTSGTPPANSVTDLFINLEMRQV